MSLTPTKYNATPLPNGVVEYNGPGFDNHINWLGWTFIGAMTAGGAYEGYRSNLALRWSGWERKPERQPLGNAALGALAGLTTSALLTLIVGGSAPPVTSDNAAKWLDKFDDRMLLIPTDTLHPGLPVYSLRAISQKGEASFDMRSINDARFYLSIFPNSPYRDQLLDGFTSRLSHDSLLAFAAIVRGLPSEQRAIERYIGDIREFDEAIDAALHLPYNQPAIEQRAGRLVGNLSDLKRFMAVFPASSSSTSIALRIRDNVKRSEIPDFLHLFPSIDDQQSQSLKLRYIRSSTTTMETIEALRRYPEFRDEADHQASHLAHSIDDYRAYLSTFPDGAAASSISRRLKEELRLSEPFDTDDNESYE
jgi:hypothetical protein